jgi:hypothetical protein
MSAKYPAILYDHGSPRILVADVTSGQPRPAAHPDWLVLSSDHAPWQDSLLVEQYRRPPFESPEHAPHAYQVGIHLSPSSILEWWIAGERPRRQRVTPGDVHLTSAGVPMWYRLQESSEILMLALTPSFMQHAAHELTGAAPSSYGISGPSAMRRSCISAWRSRRSWRPAARQVACMPRA